MIGKWFRKWLGGKSPSRAANIPPAAPSSKPLPTPRPCPRCGTRFEELVFFGHSHESRMNIKTGERLPGRYTPRLYCPRCKNNFDG